MVSAGDTREENLELADSDLALVLYQVRVLRPLITLGRRHSEAKGGRAS